MTDTAVRFHLSLNVADLARSIDFYTRLLGREPAKARPDYAKFETDDPPVVLSLEPTPRPLGGPLNHLGFRFPSMASLVAAQERLERGGISTNREDGVECCYAKQTKFWVLDPDRTLWEMYVLEGDIDHRGAGQSEEAIIAPVADQPARSQAIWTHTMTDPVPTRIPAGDGSVDEVRLRGTFNLRLDDAARAGLAQEAWRVLKPGGKVFVHVLVGEEAVDGPTLPGPAARVQFVPHEAAPLRALESAGFQSLYQAKFGSGPCFQPNGVPMRELQLEAWKPGPAGECVSVIYRGPFRKVTDDAGYEYPRGKRVTVSHAAAELLKRGTTADAFVMLPAGQVAAASCGA